MIIKIRKIGKFFEIKKICNETVVVRYAKESGIKERISMLLSQGVLNV